LRIGQRSGLSRRVVGELVSMFPDVPNVAMSVAEFERATCCNRDAASACRQFPGGTSTLAEERNQ